MSLFKNLGKLIGTSVSSLNKKDSNNDYDYDEYEDEDEDYEDDGIFNYYDSNTCISCGQSLSHSISYLPWEDGSNEYAYIICSNCGCKNLFE